MNIFGKSRFDNIQILIYNYCEFDFW